MDGLWRSFLETGNPFCYLMLKESEKGEISAAAARKLPD